MPLYGSDRVGTYRTFQKVIEVDGNDNRLTGGCLTCNDFHVVNKSFNQINLDKGYESEWTRELNHREYELKDHLGNVRALVHDMKDSTNKAIILAYNNPYPFGMNQPGRTYSGVNYRWGFQGQEQDPEWLDGAVVFKYRVHDPRLGRFLSVDPLTKTYPHYTPYSFSGNRVLDRIELEGAEPAIAPRLVPWTFPRPVINIPRAPSIPNIPATTIPVPPVSLNPEFIEIEMVEINKQGKPEVMNIDKPIDWANNPPQNPEALGEDWEETTHPDAKKNNPNIRQFKNKKTGEKVDYHHEHINKKGQLEPTHWHRHNPNYDKKQGPIGKYLDKNGNVVNRYTWESHIFLTSNFAATIPTLLGEHQKELNAIKKERDKLSIFKFGDWKMIRRLNNKRSEIEEKVEKLEDHKKKVDWYYKKAPVN